MTKPPRGIEPLFPTHEEPTAFHIARATAINAYAMLEQSLASLFAYLMGSPPDYAGVPFFKINNARTVRAILTRLLKKKHKSDYSLFWNSVDVRLGPISDKRNAIVHWGIMSNVYFNKQGTESFIETTLMPPNYWDINPNTPSITIGQMYSFIDECWFLTRLMNMFVMVISGQFEKLNKYDATFGAVQKAWLEIFAQPATYPPPSSHPLYQTPSTQQSQPQPSQE